MDELLHGYVRFERTLRLIDGSHDRNTILSHLYFGGGIRHVQLIEKLTKGVSEGPEASEAWLWLERHLDQPLNLLQLVFSQKYRMQTLLQRHDRIGMAESIEIRVPFLSPRFVQWVNKLPPTMKFDPTTAKTKVLLREIMVDRLPQQILTKPKDSFLPDMARWLHQSPMREWVTELVSNSKGFCQSHLDGSLANKIVENHYSGADKRDVLIWQLFSLEMWHETFGSGVRQTSTVPEN